MGDEEIRSMSKIHLRKVNQSLLYPTPTDDLDELLSMDIITYKSILRVQDI